MTKSARSQELTLQRKLERQVQAAQDAIGATGEEKESPENQKDADRSSQENEGRPKGVLRPRAHDFGQKLEEPEAIVLQIVS